MKKIIILISVCSVFLLSSCAPVYLSEIKKIGENEYLVSGQKDNNGQLYKCVKVGNVLKCKILSAESTFSK